MKEYQKEVEAKYGNIKKKQKNIQKKNGIM